MPAGQLVGATTKRHSGRGPNDRRSLGETILDRRIRGEQMRVICKHLGITEHTGYNYMRLALDARIPPTVDEYRRIQNEALDSRELAQQHAHRTGAPQWKVSAQFVRTSLATFAPPAATTRRVRDERAEEDG